MYVNSPGGSVTAGIMSKKIVHIHSTVGLFN